MSTPIKKQRLTDWIRCGSKLSTVWKYFKYKRIGQNQGDRKRCLRRTLAKGTIWVPQKDYRTFPLCHRGQFPPIQIMCQSDLVKAYSGNWWAFCLGVSWEEFRRGWHLNQSFEALFLAMGVGTCQSTQHPDRAEWWTKDKFTEFSRYGLFIFFWFLMSEPQACKIQDWQGVP